MRFDMRDLEPTDRYKLLTGVVVPRPIAWVTTLNEDGSVNAAPFSFFNAMGSDPAVVALGPADRPDGSPKDTALNIRRTGEFVVNLVTEALMPAMNVTAADFPPGADELRAAGLTAAPSEHVRVPRILESPVSLECREATTVMVGRTRVVLGEVLAVHVPEGLVNLEKYHVNTPALGLVARMGGRGGYVRTTDLVEFPRVTHAQWLRQTRETDAPEGET